MSDPRDNFTICTHGHDGNRIGACEREAAPDAEFCGWHGGRDFDPLDVFVDDGADFERAREGRVFADVDDYRKYGRHGL